MLTIAAYSKIPVAFHAYNARYVGVAQRVAALITSRLPDVIVEHIGSTAVPNCGGRGVVDLMVLYVDGSLDATLPELTALGFQWISPIHASPDEWPKGMGAFNYDDDLFRLHLHVLPIDHPAADGFRAFRDRLRADPDLVAAYVEHKQAILAAGITDPIDYTAAKRDFVAAHEG